jgi:hypothetical protein
MYPGFSLSYQEVYISNKIANNTETMGIIMHWNHFWCKGSLSCTSTKLWPNLSYALKAKHGQ